MLLRHVLRGPNLWPPTVLHRLPLYTSETIHRSPVLNNIYKSLIETYFANAVLQCTSCLLGIVSGIFDVPKHDEGNKLVSTAYNECGDGQP